MKKIHYTSGLPRACSSLLQNLLAQNPQVHASATSGVHEIGYIARGFFETEEFKTFLKPADGERQYFDFVRAGISGAYDSATDRPIVVDKCRSWVGHLDQLYKIFPDAKVIVPVRDVRGILCSLEKKRRDHPSRMTGIEKANPQNWTTVEKRAQAWLSMPPLSIALERIHDARRFWDRLHFVHAEDLTTNPKETMQRVWDYLGLTFDNHDFQNVSQYTTEHELGWPFGDHTIRKEVRPLVPEWHDILGRQFSEAINQKFGWINTL